MNPVVNHAVNPVASCSVVNPVVNPVASCPDSRVFRYLEGEVEGLEVALHVLQLDEARGVHGAAVDEGAGAHHSVRDQIKD